MVLLVGVSAVLCTLPKTNSFVVLTLEVQRPSHVYTARAPVNIRPLSSSVAHNLPQRVTTQMFATMSASRRVCGPSNSSNADMHFAYLSLVDEILAYEVHGRPYAVYAKMYVRPYVRIVLYQL
jgi:hypothetical protein